MPKITDTITDCRVLLRSTQLLGYDHYGDFKLAETDDQPEMGRIVIVISADVYERDGVVIKNKNIFSLIAYDAAIELADRFVAEYPGCAVSTQYHRYAPEVAQETGSFYWSQGGKNTAINEKIIESLRADWKKKIQEIVEYTNSLPRDFVCGVAKYSSDQK